MALSIASGLTVIIAIVLLVRKRTAAAIAGFFILFSLSTRMLATIYIDVNGPIFAYELDRYVGGTQTAAPFALFVLVVIGALASIFRPSVLTHLLAGHDTVSIYGEHAERAIFVAVAGFVALLYLEMLVIGPIPLFTGMDRITYDQQVAGPFHTLVMGNGAVFAFIIGMMFVLPRLRGSEFDFRYLTLFGAMMVYFGLTGNRFSVFYRDISFFLMAVAALPAIRAAGRTLGENRSGFARFLTSRTAVVLTGGLAAAAIGMLLFNSFYNVRGYRDADLQFQQRSIVQPVELWATALDRLEQRGGAPSPSTWYDTFTNPVDPTRNTTIQALMIQDLGYARATELLEAGQQYAGGYPEILLELVGFLPGVVFAIAFALVSAWVLRFAVIALCRGYLMTAWITIYIYFGTSLFYIGGMLNFVLAISYWIKIAILAAVYLFEKSRVRIVAPHAVTFLPSSDSAG
jgi:hypothetical protein